MKVTAYFVATRSRPDRADILDEWIERVMIDPEYESVQSASSRGNQRSARCQLAAVRASSPTATSTFARTTRWLRCSTAIAKRSLPVKPSSGM